MQGAHRKSAVAVPSTQQRSGTPSLVAKGSARQTPREDSSGVAIGGPSHPQPGPASNIPRKVNVPIVGAGQSAAAGQRKSPVPMGTNLRRSPVSTLVERSESSKSNKQSAAKTRTYLTQGSCNPSNRALGVSAVSAQVTPRAVPAEKGTPRAVSRDGNAGAWNPTVIVNPNFDFSVRHQTSAVSKSFNEDGAQQAPYEQTQYHRLSPAAADSSRRQHGAAGGAAGRRGGGLVHGTPIMNTKGVEEAKLRPAQHLAWSSLDSGLAALSTSIPEDIDDNQIETAIGLLQPHKDLQQDQVLQDLLRMIKKRIHTNQQAQRMRASGPGEDVHDTGADRYVATSDSSTQVQTVEAASQTELCEFKEKKIRPKQRIKDGHSCSYSDSDVPSDTTESQKEHSGPPFGRRRRRSLGVDSVSLSTNSPRESVDGGHDSYSRELSDASGPTSVHSVLVSAASSTDASQTATLPTMDNLSADSPLKLTKQALGERPSSTPTTPFGRKTRDASSSVGTSPMHVHVQQKDKAKKKEIQVSVEDEAVGEGEDEREWEEEEEDEMRDYGRAFGRPTGGRGGERGGSPPPCVETILEMHLLLEQMYRKIGVTGPVLYPPVGGIVDGQPVRPLCRTNGIFSPATVEMRRLTLESMHLTDDSSAPIRSFDTSVSPERPPNPVGYPSEWSPSQGGKVITADPTTFLPSEDVHRSINVTKKVRMGNSPPKHVRPVPPLSIPNAQPSPRHTPRPRHSENASVESPLSTPREGSAFLAHINSARSSANGSDGSTPRLLAMAMQQHQYHEGTNPHHGHVPAPRMPHRAHVSSAGHVTDVPVKVSGSSQPGEF